MKMFSEIVITISVKEDIVFSDPSTSMRVIFSLSNLVISVAGQPTLTICREGCNAVSLWECDPGHKGKWTFDLISCRSQAPSPKYDDLSVCLEGLTGERM